MHDDDDEPFGHEPELHGDDELTDIDGGPDGVGDESCNQGKILPITPPTSANRIPHKYRKSAGASVLAAGLLGLRDIIDPAKDNRPVVEQYADDDDVDRPLEVYLDPDDPSKSMVVIRDPSDNN